MRIERVSVEGFGPLAQFDAVLEPKRLNLFIGPNESGKSSFASAVVSCLFGFQTLDSEELARPWSGTKHKASVIFSTLSGRFRVTREFDTHQVQVDRLREGSEEAESTPFRGLANPRGRSAEQMQYEELLRGWFGFTEARLFRESAFVHESALETQVSPELRHLISGAVEADYQQIQDALLERLDSLTVEHPFDARARKRTNRSIENRIEKIQMLRDRRSRSEYVLTELKSRHKEREEIESRLLDLRADLAGKEQLRADLEAWLQLREEQRKLLKRAPAIGQELVTARRARGQVQEIDRKITESLGYLANAPEEVEQDLMRLGMLRSQRGRHQKNAEEERRALDAPLRKSSGRAYVTGFVFAALAAGGAWFATHQVAAALGAAGLGLVAGFFIGRDRGQKERSRELAEAHIRVLDENIRTLSQEIDGIEIKVNPFLAGRTVEVVLEDVKRNRGLNQERREAAAVLHSLPTPERLETESKEIDEAVGSLRSKEKLLLQQSPFLAPLRDDPVKAAEAAERLRREATALRTKLEAEQGSLDAFMRRAGGGEGDAENLESLDEMIVGEEETLVREERQRGALLLALEVLRDSVMAYQQEHVGRLAALTESTLSRLTNGRYHKVRLDAEFRPTLTVNDRSDVPLSSISRGARDAFYLALRAALARELAAREPLPLILDDPIAHLDEERRANLLALLEDLAAEIQVILLTHDRRVLNNVRDAHVLGVGTSSLNRESSRKFEVRR
jgi:energy-coupling factor transporter ATP-binding protein EcfA2